MLPPPAVVSLHVLGLFSLLQEGGKKWRITSGWSAVDETKLGLDHVFYRKLLLTL